LKEFVYAQAGKRPRHFFRHSESHDVGERLGKGCQEYPGLGGIVEISCLEVIRELSNYMDKDVTPELRTQIVAHLPTCAHCTAVYDGLRNTINLIGDGRSFELPEGFSQRLLAKLNQQS
jgi:hypothetical protein